VNDVLVPPDDVSAAFKDIHALVSATAHGEDTPKHLQVVRVSTGGGRGTTVVDRVTRGYIQRRRGVAVDKKLGESKVKRLMCNILIESLMGHRLYHAHDEGSEST
jgi:predicted membrane GTPase involved in stress response